MKCPSCQFDNPEDTKFCRECGARLRLACPKCGKVVPSGSKFCSECGSPLAGKIEAERAKPAVEAERKQVTILFADVAHYTSLSEKLDPEEVHQIMDDCFQILMEEIHRYEGTINQFTGDGVMALFGAPLVQEDHAQRACHAALAIQKAMTHYGNKLTQDYGIDFWMRIGLNSGPFLPFFRIHFAPSPTSGLKISLPCFICTSRRADKPPEWPG